MMNLVRMALIQILKISLFVQSISDVPSAIPSTTDMPSAIPSTSDVPSAILCTSDGPCEEDNHIPPELASCLICLFNQQSGEAQHHIFEKPIESIMLKWS
ncbi:hypothetical protein PoB_006586000 [Plakobranchus ocellatus]|uniref:Secreted protein n=1 Tax=Plakobranchus ocellatus TaxID=259542 RepID=A0AAV4D5C6_9GAST|nr:hypothetical protein PoB_006586000 [Plakobranchus ocellatus]